ncbi:Probable sensor protein precursor [Flavobacterium indicum GPTSA100-9 = DSM 17447]|uniref:Probable sensor protein n=1 Tax=Flavobacterium indicum (strain DSM 17447 / CIP 109464 / GPTSA100-9) TaxID=1094466 RepID=H8XNZ8_FLAIG|nr:two-component regulator propeller domain-containing protein [Flavobacterium indicum]CCG52265.1 Probable sensor protein precursor [Flavobacterium indicum GPTSA100-9 = DSM 17447]CCG52989.1 Probable sensor protein precursor [Flavobacterium indicum GPTSA100-9 = DSM 17447]
MKKTILILLTTYFSFNLNAQNLFPIKLENCKADKFCLDCGDTKATYKEKDFEKLQERLNESLNLKGVSGTVKFQVLVDSKGKGCVLSYNDKSKSQISLRIIEELNNFNKWVPAITKNKKEEKVSINLIFTVKDNKLSGKIERVDMEAFEKSFDKPNSPEIFNKDYTYKNENIKNYKMTVWNTKNSKLSDNSLDNISFDKDGLLWLVVDKGVQSFNGSEFINLEANNTNTKVTESYFAIGVDNNNTKWFDGLQSIYSYDKTWNKHDINEIGIDGAYDIINNPKTEELFFCSDKGLTIFSKGKWKTINKEIVKELPSNRVYYAKKDSKNRIWIGTFSGSIMIDEKGKATNFENTSTVLKGKCITSMDEDENGNIYFSLYEFGDKNAGQVNRDEGIAIYYTNGAFKQFTTSNSGMPFNHTNCVLYDKIEKVLWISTDRAGLVRYDLNNNWENYHNENSEIPTSYISTMTFDKNGNLFLATRQGLVKIERK